MSQPDGGALVIRRTGAAPARLCSSCFTAQLSEHDGGYRVEFWYELSPTERVQLVVMNRPTDHQLAEQLTGAGLQPLAAFRVPGFHGVARLARRANSPAPSSR